MTQTPGGSGGRKPAQNTGGRMPAGWTRTLRTELRKEVAEAETRLAALVDGRLGEVQAQMQVQIQAMSTQWAAERAERQARDRLQEEIARTQKEQEAKRESARKENEMRGAERDRERRDQGHQVLTALLAVLAGLVLVLVALLTPHDKLEATIFVGVVVIALLVATVYVMLRLRGGPKPPPAAPPSTGHTP